MKRILKFSATWCQPCKMLAKTLEDMELEFPLEEIDIDQNKDLLEKFNIRGVPTMVLMDGEDEVARHSGYMTSAQVTAWLAAA